MNIQYGECGMDTWQSQISDPVGLGVDHGEHEDPDQDLFDVHCCQSQAVAGGDWHDVGCPVGLLDAAWAAFSPEAKPF